MWFWDISDWFGRSGPYLLNAEHITFLVLVTLGGGILLPLLLRKAKRKTIHTVLIALWAFALVIDLIKWGSIWIDDIINHEAFNVGGQLPLHFCSMFLFIMPFALFAKNEKLKMAATNFVCTVSMVMGYMALYLSTWMMNNFSLFSFPGMHTMLYHAVLFVCPMIMLLTGYYQPKWKDMFGGMAVFGVIAAIMIAFDNIFVVDYMYLYDESSLGTFHFISQNVPHRLVWTLIAVLGYVGTIAIMHSLIMGIKTLVAKHKNKSIKIKTNQQ